MADTKISGLPAATSIGNADVIPCVNGAATKKVTKQLFLTALGGEDITIKSSSAKKVRLDTDSGTANLEVWDSNVLTVNAGTMTMGGNTATQLGWLISGAGFFKAGAGSDLTLWGDAGSSQLFLSSVGGGPSILTSNQGLMIQYSTAVGASWSGAPPADVWSALDRIAVLLAVLNGGVGP